MEKRNLEISSIVRTRSNFVFLYFQLMNPLIRIDWRIEMSFYQFPGYSLILPPQQKFDKIPPPPEIGSVINLICCRGYSMDFLMTRIDKKFSTFSKLAQLKH